MNNIQVRPMKIEDVDRVLEIEKDSFTTPWSKDAFTMEIEKNELAKYLVAEVDDLVVGYGGIWLIVGEGHITNIAVISDYRKMGVGNKLLEGLIEICKERDIESMTLEVREINYPAQKLYKKYGFEAMGVRPNYYQEDNEDAIIMWKNF